MNLSTLLVLVFLVGMWAALALGPIVQRRGPGNRSGDSIKSFQRTLSVLDRSRPGRPAMVRSLSTAPSARRMQAEAQAARQPVRASQVRARAAAFRRRQIVTVLSGVAFTSVVLALVVGGRIFIALFALSSALLVGYLALMFQVLHRQAEREMKVAFLPHRDAGAEPTVLLQLREAASQNRR